MTVVNFDRKVSASMSLEILGDLALLHCREAGIWGEYIAALIKRRDYAALCKYEPMYYAGCDSHTMLNVRQALGFFQKLEPLDIGVDKRAMAKEKFIETEGSCLRTNHILNLYSAGDFQFLPAVERVIKRAQRKIENVLGPVPQLSQLDFLFGPGATTSVKRRNACVREKLSAVPSCTTNLLPLVPDLVDQVPHYANLHIDEVGSDPDTMRSYLNVVLHDGKVAFVPKNAKTYRTVMTEPTLNALVQSAFGRFMTRRLLRIGQDLRDQGRNKDLALEGSLTGALATLDLSSASDSISTELVAHLLPYEWFAALSLCRTPTVELDGKVLHLHKFSSMGNGFTFPLQTLIFWALVKSASEIVDDPEQRVSVYGDDIICGVKAIPLVADVFAAVGFTINFEKSFWDGPFRESCGGDYYNGIDIRPFYVKDWLDGQVLFCLHNFYYRSHNYPMASRVLGHIDPSLRIYGPDGYGDGHLLGEWSPKPYKRELQYAGWTFETYTFKNRLHREILPGDKVLPCYTAYERSFVPLDEWGFAIQPVKTQHVKGPIQLEPDECAEMPLDVFAFKEVQTYIPCVVLPGTRGLKRIKIYTLST